MERVDEYKTCGFTFKITYRPKTELYQTHCVAGARGIFLIGNFINPLSAKLGCRRWAELSGSWVRAEWRAAS